MKDLTNLLIKIYEGRFERKDGESDEDYLNRVANQDMMLIWERMIRNVYKRRERVMRTF